MKNIKSITLELWPLDEDLSCRCNGAHQVCLQCAVCGYKNNNYSIVDDMPTQQELAKYIDHTNLKPDATNVEIIRLCQEARTYDFASVCINPCNVKLAKREMDKRTVCSVIGFPLGANLTRTKIEEVRLALKQGATECDMVLNIAELKEQGYNYVLTEIEKIAEICHENDAILKVILETCLLNERDKIIACLIAKKAGADFVKTSTGFSKSGATVGDIMLMRTVVG
ncbi:MAG TPA: deoxyribose-phosphate aldolase, partial [Candidatus Cloacimonetes bacterium]|nr:deoxyribose-phosphate aldolase [Candidatus Cloacimonadota bacterium]